MAPDKDPSSKKTTQQTISISSKLKDRIEEYVNTNHQKNPEDKRFRSISAFYNYIMEKAISAFDKGKTLDDLNRLVDSGTRSFFDQFTFRGIIPFHELITKSHRYKKLDFRQIPGFLYAMRDLYISDTESMIIEKIKKQFEILKVFYMKNNLTKDMSLEVYTDVNPRYPKAIFEQLGIYKNLFFENCKLTAAILGILGAKITDIIFSNKDLYCRFNLESTDLIYRKDLAKRERMKLIDHNSKFLINYKMIVNDEDFYLWMNLAEDKDIIINFSNENVKKKWIDLVVKDLNELCDKDEFLISILRFFEKLHWVDIENEKEPSFRIRLSEDKNEDEKRFLLELISKYSKFSEIDGKYYLE